MARAAVFEVIAGDAGKDHVIEPHCFHGFSEFTRLVLVYEAPRIAGFDVAEPAGARAGVTEYHESGSAGRPALRGVWTCGFTADRVQFLRADQRPDLSVLLACRSGG